ncbi:MAG: hypothetical protein ABEJ34_02825 [Haloferacaceae archaeon]
MEGSHGVLNEHTRTVHKQETGASTFHTVCGATHLLDPDRLREVPVERALADHSATKCGRCFEDGGGY